MRCSQCGAFLNCIIIDTYGKRFYECTCGLTAFFGRHTQVGYMRLCGNIQDDTGKEYHGYITFLSGDRVQSVKV